MTRAIIAGLMLLMLGFIGREIYIFFWKKTELNAQVADINSEMEKLYKENSQLGADIGYYNDQDNLEKEARAELNYKAPGEKLIIVVPPKR